MLDLFAIANSNRDTGKTRLDAAISSRSSRDQRVVEEFLNWLQASSVISINVRLLVLIELLEGRSLQNIYEWADEQAALCSRPADSILRERLGSFYSRRITFDAAVIEGRKLRYGAMYVDGTGLTSYAPYCLVLSRKFTESATRLAYLPGDSLMICFDGDDRLNESKLKQAVTSHSCRHLMVARERITELLSVSQHEWPRLVISGGTYFEALFLDDVRLTTIDVVKISKAEYQRMWEIAFTSFARKLNDAERANVQDFVLLRRAVLSGSVKLEVINEYSS